ncbi:DUF2188 domain-containing protein [Tissierella creatinophila]|uniref:DUF2188 domain-containing protein n=1 Tax=Tissierella creatinophila DSM 6911 TaxID=1123403 RepID=A0A1U7M779_TISCR|nr:DUF2188 domain-containing protein [Tissierella creatinophila]OLS03069.1 hypothetical protein TICRE_07650 [Tissierella creatinophila DSM 6911]
MPWTEKDYPDAMKNLEEKTRNKAIEIANSLLDDDYDEPRSIAIAITQAKEWASKIKIIQANGDHQHVVPHNGQWAILREGNERVSHVYDTKEEALKKAKEMGKNENVRVIVHKKDGKIQDNLIP